MIPSWPTSVSEPPLPHRSVNRTKFRVCSCSAGPTYMMSAHAEGGRTSGSIPDLRIYRLFGQRWEETTIPNILRTSHLWKPSLLPWRCPHSLPCSHTHSPTSCFPRVAPLTLVEVGAALPACLSGGLTRSLARVPCSKARE